MYRCRVQTADSEVAGQQISLGCAAKWKGVHLVGAASPSTVGRAFRVCGRVHDRRGEGLPSLHVHQKELQAENHRVLVDVSTAVACLSKFACGRVVLQPCGGRSCNRFIVCCPLWPSYVWTGCGCPSAVTQAAGTYSTVQCCRAFCYVFPNYPVLADGSLDSYLDYQLHIMRWVEKCIVVRSQRLKLACLSMKRSG
jgi:hypothetical protein